MTASPAELPKYNDIHWPALLALRELGGSATNDEIAQKVIDLEGFDEDTQSILHRDGPMTAIEYRLHWARTYLKGMGLAHNAQRGVWELTEQGWRVQESEVPDLRRQYLDGMRQKREEKKAAETAAPSTSDATQASSRSAGLAESDDLLPPEGSEASEIHWKDALLETVLDLSPQEFEQLAQWLLRVEGFIETQVMGRSHDGGIDGQGRYKISLLSFHVFFQCKRYRQSVGSSAVRDFRGAMTGRGDKGLLITTGSFTAEARKEARRDGAPPIDLIDGSALCDLLKKHEKGVRVTTRLVEDIEVVAGDFHGS